MRPPNYWNNPACAPGWQARLLAPLAAIYAAATARRLSKKPDITARVPVICIGNLNIGGTGKTPATIALSLRLQGHGLTVHIVSRGYGGALSGPVQVDEVRHSARDTGDEPLLLAAFTPTWVARDRAAGVRAAQTAGAEVILLDDGFQNPSVQKDLSIIVVDARRGFGNGRVIPAGPLREPVAVGLGRCDILLSIGGAGDQDVFDANWSDHITLPHCRGQLVPLETGMDWADVKVLAFAGIGHPDKFFDTLRRLGAKVVRTKALDDHQPLSDVMLKRLEHEAATLNAQLVTTEKDAARLPKAYRAKVLTLPVRLQLTDWSEIDRRLAALGLISAG